MPVKRTPVAKPSTKRKGRKKTTKKKTTKKTKKLKAKKPKADSKPKSKPKGKKPLTRAAALSAYSESIKDEVARVVNLEEREPKMWVSTGCLEMDRVLTYRALSGQVYRGIPCGRVVEIFGPAHIGKSTLLDLMYANVQRVGGVAVLLETDTSRDVNYTQSLGVDTRQLQRIEFNDDQGSIENAGDKAVETLRWWKKNAPELPVILGLDALGVTPTQEEIKKSLSQGSTASAAKIMRVLCRKVAPLLPGSNVALVILNHEYQQISFGGGGVKPQKTYGGDALTLLSTLRVRLHSVKDQWIKRGKEGVVVGRKVGFKLVKWKLGTKSYFDGEFAMMPGQGVDNSFTLWNTLTRAGVIAVSGTWGAVNIDGEVTNFQGWQQLRQLCAEQPEFYKKLIDVYWGVVDAAL